MKERENERERDTIREEAKCRERRRNKETIEEEERERERCEGSAEGKRGETKRAKRQRSIVVDEEAKMYVRTYVRG